jgi:hypothetical protein
MSNIWKEKIEAMGARKIASGLGFLQMLIFLISILVLNYKYFIFSFLDSPIIDLTIFAILAFSFSYLSGLILSTCNLFEIQTRRLIGKMANQFGKFYIGMLFSLAALVACLYGIYNKFVLNNPVDYYFIPISGMVSLAFFLSFYFEYIKIHEIEKSLNQTRSPQ